MEQAEFEACWHAHAARIAAYAARHVGVESAADVTSATFLSAWRSWRHVPDHALPWLISAAHGHIRNLRRPLRRHDRLESRLRMLDASTMTSPGADATAERRMAALAALSSCDDMGAPDDPPRATVFTLDGLAPSRAIAIKAGDGPIRVAVATTLDAHEIDRLLEQLAILEATP